MTQSTEQAEVVVESPEVFENAAAAVDDGRFLAKARRLASKLPFVRHAVAMWHALKDEATPVGVKAMIAGALLYFVLPVDMVPDFLAGMGFTDDAAVMIATLRAISSHLRPKHYERADETLGAA